MKKSKLLLGLFSMLAVSLFCKVPVLAAPTTETNDNKKMSDESEFEIIRVRPVLDGESLKDISKSVYGTGDYAEDIYNLNKDKIASADAELETGMILVLPEPGEDSDVPGWEYCYQEVWADWDPEFQVDSYVSKNAGCSISDYFIYYDEEGEGQTVKVCYPQLTSGDGRDMTAVNKAIEEVALYNTDKLLINMSDALREKCDEGKDFTYEWCDDTVHYDIAYLDENIISVIFDDHYFNGSVFGEYGAFRAVTVNLNTGHVYTKQELWEDTTGIASFFRNDMKDYYSRKDSSVSQRMCDEVLTDEVMAELFLTEGFYDGRHQTSVFFTKNSVGLGLTYWCSTDSYIARGWFAEEYSLKEVDDYKSGSEFWDLWKYKERNENKILFGVK